MMTLLTWIATVCKFSYRYFILILKGLFVSVMFMCQDFGLTNKFRGLDNFDVSISSEFFYWKTYAENITKSIILLCF